MNEHFRYTLRQGQLGESIISRWLIERGNSIMPVYEKEIDDGKGPQFYSRDGHFAAPDLFVFAANSRNGGERFLWAEAKHKTVFSWYRKRPAWVTGIDLNHFEDYRRVEQRSGVPVWLFFLHSSSTPSAADLANGCPRVCPTGLFGERLSVLAADENISHRSDRHGAHGMIYWRESSLKLFAPREELLSASRRDA